MDGGVTVDENLLERPDVHFVDHAEPLKEKRISPNKGYPNASLIYGLLTFGLVLPA